MTAMEEEVDDRFAGIDIDSLLNRTDHRPMTYGRKKALYEAPEFIQRLNGEETVLEGQSLCIECKVRGFPVPTLRWFKDDEEILDHPRIHVESSGTGTYCLIIDNVHKGDEAAYRCRAENVEGACSSFFFLSVKGKPKSHKKKDQKSSPNRRTVSFPPMFATIVEKVEEEEKQGRELEALPPSPMTDFYYALTLKGRQSWPTFVGDWAFANGGHSHKRRTDDEGAGLDTAASLTSLANGDHNDNFLSPNQARLAARRSLRRGELAVRSEAKKQRLEEESKSNETEEEKRTREEREKKLEEEQKKREEEMRIDIERKRRQETMRLRKKAREERIQKEKEAEKLETSVQEMEGIETQQNNNETTLQNEKQNQEQNRKLEEEIRRKNEERNLQQIKRNQEEKRKEEEQKKKEEEDKIQKEKERKKQEDRKKMEDELARKKKEEEEQQRLRQAEMKKKQEQEKLHKTEEEIKKEEIKKKAEGDAKINDQNKRKFELKNKNKAEEKEKQQLQNEKTAKDLTKASNESETAKSGNQKSVLQKFAKHLDSKLEPGAAIAGPKQGITKTSSDKILNQEQQKLMKPTDSRNASKETSVQIHSDKIYETESQQGFKKLQTNENKNKVPIGSDSTKKEDVRLQQDKTSQKNTGDIDLKKVALKSWQGKDSLLNKQATEQKNKLEEAKEREAKRAHELKLQEQKRLDELKVKEQKRLDQLREEQKRKDELKQKEQMRLDELKQKEQKRLDELKQKEQKRLDELREEQKRKDESKQKEQIRLDELKQKEQKRLDELKQKEQKRLDELKQKEQKRLDELKEEQTRKDELKQKEQKRLEELKQEQRHKDELKQREQKQKEEIKAQEKKRLEELKQQELKRIEELKQQEQKRIEELKQQEQRRIEELKLQEQRRIKELDQGKKADRKDFRTGSRNSLEQLRAREKEQIDQLRQKEQNQRDELNRREMQQRNEIRTKDEKQIEDFKLKKDLKLAEEIKSNTRKMQPALTEESGKNDGVKIGEKCPRKEDVDLKDQKTVNRKWAPTTMKQNGEKPKELLQNAEQKTNQQPPRATATDRNTKQLEDVKSKQQLFNLGETVAKKKEEKEYEDLRREYKKEQIRKEQLWRQHEQDVEKQHKKDEEAKQKRERDPQRTLDSSADDEFKVKVHKRDYSFDEMRKCLEAHVGGETMDVDEHKYWDNILEKHDYSIHDLRKTFDPASNAEKQSRMQTRRSNMEDADLSRMKRAGSVTDRLETFTNSMERPKKKPEDAQKRQKGEEFFNRGSSITELRQQLTENIKAQDEPKKVQHLSGQREADITIRRLRAASPFTQLEGGRRSKSPAPFQSSTSAGASNAEQADEPKPVSRTQVELSKIASSVAAKRASFNELLSQAGRPASDKAQKRASCPVRDSYGSREIPIYKRAANWSDDIEKSQTIRNPDEPQRLKATDISDSQKPLSSLPYSIKDDSAVTPDEGSSSWKIRPFVYNSTRTTARRFTKKQ